jgi:hypothetical protein
MPPLMTRDEALALGEFEDRPSIEALIERAWRVRTERFRGLHRPLPARERKVRRMRGGPRVLCPIALRGGADSTARDDVARADNGANPHPGNRSGWLEGESPDVIATHLEGSLTVTLWNPSKQLRFAKKSSVPPRPDGAPNRGPTPITP